MDSRFKPSIAPIKKIKAIQFSVLSPEYIKNISVTQSIYDLSNNQLPAGIFDNNKIYDQATKKPIIGGVNDPRMGSASEQENPGYFGHIELVRPVYHYGFLNLVLDILRSVSFYTSKLLISDDDLAHIKRTTKRKKRIKEIIKRSKQKVCKDTKRLLPLYSKDSLRIVVEHFDPEMIGDGPAKRTLNPMDAYAILEKISNKDAESLGLNPKFCRPEWLLVSVIPVPPPHVRPAVSMSSTQRCEDDLTHKINDILKSNIALKNSIKKNDKPHMIEQYENLLQYDVSTFFDNKISGQKPSQQRSGKPLKTITQRLSGKDGRIRGNLMGKRVDFSARTVITADPKLSIDQVGVPLQIALNLTIPEKVTKFNIDKLQKLVNNGPSIHPGARYIIKEDSRKIDLKFSKVKHTLVIGQTVERHLDNDDVVIFNRQPSLHKMSIMAHRVKIQKGMTFRLNLACTSPYNADFDGDEMNLHVPQSLAAKVEAENLMMVHKMIVSPQANKPVMGIIQDSLLASARMSRRDTFIDRSTMMNIMYQCDLSLPDPAILVKKSPGVFYPLWTGKQVLSSIMPKDLYYNKKSNDAPDNDDIMTLMDTKVCIIGGVLLSGIIDKKSIGTSEGSIIHILFNDYGPERAREFMNNIQLLVNYWILQTSFSIGIGDTITDKKTEEEIKVVLQGIKEKVDGLIENSSNNPARLEKIINTELNSARDEVGLLAQRRLNMDNNIKATVSAGSKGNSLNISQICSALGQQNIEGQRVSYGFDKRTLVCYQKNDMGKESRGFIENSYVKGLTPQEFFFHAMAGREGLIDTACKSVTADTRIVIQENGVTKSVEIGKWIDERLDREINKGLIERYKEKNMELLNIVGVTIPTGDHLGNITWEDVTAITRHDPGNVIYEVTTEGGRSVKVPESKSLLIWDGTKFEGKLTPEVKIGDFMPVTVNLPAPPVIITEVSLMNYLSKKEVIFGDDFLIAKKMLEEAEENMLKDCYLRCIDRATIIARKCCRSFASSLTLREALDFYTKQTKEKKEYNKKKGVEMLEENQKKRGDKGKGEGGAKKGEKSAMHGSMLKIERGWWDKHNGKDFTLPYTKKSSLKRTLIRSKIENIENGFIYNYDAAREVGIADKFELNNENGLFIGLFLAEGNVHGGEICIANNDQVIRNFVMSWFKKREIPNKEYLRKIEDRGTSHTVRANSVLFATFLDKFLGRYSHEKYVPHEAFSAPDEFVIGLLNGYFSGDGCVSKKGYGVVSSSVSQELTTGISMLCNRLGIFGKISVVQQKKNNFGTKDIKPAYILSLQAQWAYEFAKKIPMIESKKQKRLNRILKEYKKNLHRNFTQQKDVVLDRIKSIKELSTENFPKLYDLTVSKTFNFCIGNGLNCSDTSSTGYLSRKLVKSLEDVMVNYDTTVRDASGCIVQFQYGEDAIDATYIETQLFDFQTALNPTPPQPEYEQLLKDAKLVEKINEYRGDIGNMYLPINVNIKRIIQTESLKNPFTSDTPMSKEETRKIIDEFISKFHTELFRIHLRLNLCSNIIKQINDTTLFLILDTIKHAYDKSLAHSGEMCGVLAAQSLGEASTQLCLDTFHSSGISAKNVNLGIPRFLELMNVSKNIKTSIMKCYPKPDTDLMKLENKLEYKTLKELVLSSCITTIEYSGQFEFLKYYPKVPHESDHVLILELRSDILEKLNITLFDISDKLFDYINDLFFLKINHDNCQVPMLVFSIDTFDRDEEVATPISTDEIISRLHILETDMLNKVYIQGIEGIKKVYVEKIPGQSTKYIETEGSNILDSFTIPELDHNRTVCNDIIEICDILGIEAGRKVLFDEIRNVISFDGTVINYRHISLVADIMTYRASYIPLSRHGLNRAADTSTLLKSSFEETMDVLVDAATYSQKDIIKSISEHIILGKLAPFGTGSFNVNFNNEAVKQYLSGIEEVSKVKEDVKKVEEVPKEEDPEDSEDEVKRIMSSEDEDSEDDDDEDVYVPS